VDFRALASLIAAGKTAEAWQLYAKAVPLAPLVARLCAAPCRLPCKRAGRGGAVEAGLLERFLANRCGAPSRAPFLLPQKTERVAVVGGGLRGLAAANGLARKGYQVTILEAADRLGGALRELDEGILPAKALEDEIAVLLGMSVSAKYGRSVPVDPSGAAALFDEGYDGVFVACSSPLDALAEGATLVTPVKNLLAGRRSGRIGEGDSPVYDVFDGISAAVTLDRLFQGVSVEAGREREGSGETRLYTNIEGVAAEAPVEAAEGGYDQAGAAAEAARCIGCECRECVKKCAFMLQYKLTPRRYVRMVYNNLSIAMGNHDANGMINTCALCGQCEAICPNGLNMAEVFLAARRQMVRSGKMPPSAHEFALLDMDYSLSDSFFLARHQRGSDSSAAIFFPGCQLPASEPDLVRSVYADLAGRLEGGVGLLLGCCGIMARWSGNAARFEAAKDRLTGAWKALGSAEVIAACPSCRATLEDMGIPARSIFDLLGEIGPPESGGKAGTAPGAMVLHHACGARHDEGTKRQARRLAADAGITVLEGAPDEQHPCCGYGGLMPFVDRQGAENFTALALKQLAGDDAAPLLTYCVNCRDRFRAGGRDSRHLLELLYPPDSQRRTPWKAPTWSLRQENRAKFRRDMLEELWGEKSTEAPLMELLISEDLERKLEAAHILHSDIASVISRAEAEQIKLFDAATGHFLANHRPGNVTFWVEYSRTAAGYEVHNAYSHRMSAVVSGAPIETERTAAHG
jgi:Fe-S oxidoreductase